jgi:hypothetical protein
MADVPPAGLPASSTFSFKSPYPVSVAALKQRRVSLASAPSPRIVPQWSFRDEMGLDSQPADESLHKLDSAAVNVGPAEENNGDANDDAATASTSTQEKEKRPRKKWSTEETDMLVYGIKLVSILSLLLDVLDPSFHHRIARRRQLEEYPAGPASFLSRSFTRRSQGPVCRFLFHLIYLL